MALVLAAGTSATAALTVEVAENPTANAPGFSQFVFTLISDMGDITSIDATFTGPPGSFRQFNPTSPPTIFADYNDLFPITEVPADDTHFEFDTEAHSLLTINTAESDQLLRAAFTREGGGPLDAESPTSVRFAHVVLQAGATGSFSINAVAGGAEFLDVLTSSGENTFGGNVGLLAGDYNDNGRVEQADLDLVLLNWGDSFAGLPPEWMNQRPGMGIVDQAELDGVLLNWGNGAAGIGGATAVPEPATLLSAGLLFAGAVALGPWRRTEASLRGCQRP